MLGLGLWQQPGDKEGARMAWEREEDEPMKEFEETPANNKNDRCALPPVFDFQ